MANGVANISNDVLSSGSFTVTPDSFPVFMEPNAGEVPITERPQESRVVHKPKPMARPALRQSSASALASC